MTNQDPIYISAQDMFVECVEGDRDSWGSLMRVLRSGELEQPGDFAAYGTKKGKSLAEAIHTDYWINGHIRFEATGGNVTSFAEPKTLGADFDSCSFQDIKFRRSDIDKWKAWRASIHQSLPSSYKMDEGYINVAQACFFMATSKWWSPQEISNREETHSEYAQFKEYLDAVCSGESWPPTGIHADNVWLSCVNGCLEHLKLEMTARNISEHSFRDHIIDWQQSYATLNEQLEQCADKIRQAGRIEQLNLIGQPTNFGSFQSPANLRRITANELGTEGVVLQWLSNDLRFKGKAWRDRKEPDFINVQMLRSEVEQIWPKAATKSPQHIVAAVIMPSPRATAISTEQLAEWIFNHHKTFLNKRALYKAAIRSDSGLPTLTQDDFDISYRAVFQTRVGKPPATGWPLQPEFLGREV